MKKLRIFIFIILTLSFFNTVNAQELVFVNMQKILNESKAGKQAHEFLKKRVTSENKKLEDEAKKLKKDEKDLIAKKKSISADDYKKELNSLRQKNVAYQKKRRDTNNNLLRKKNDIRNQLLKTLNPILTKYMSDNNIQIILDKKYVVMANSKTDLTNEILKILDSQLKSIDLK